MSDKRAKQLVASIMTELRAAVLSKSGDGAEWRKDAEQALKITEASLLAISSPLLKKKFEQAADAAHEFAPVLGSLGAQFLLDMISELKVTEFDEVRPALVWAAASSYKAAGKLPLAQKRLILARKLAIENRQRSVAARIAIDLGVLEYDRNDIKKARYWYQKAREDARTAKDQLVEAMAIHNMAVRKMEKDTGAARKLLEKSLEMKIKVGAPADSLAGNWTNLGILFAQEGKHKEAYNLFKKSVEVYRSFEDYPRLSLALLNLANTNAELGHLSEADRLYRKGIFLATKYYDFHTLAFLHQGYASNAFKHGHFRIAATQFRALFESLLAIGKLREATFALHDCALSTARAGDHADARKIATETLAQFEKLQSWDWYRRCLLMIATDIEKPDSDAKLQVLRKATELRGGRDLSLKLAASRALWHELIKRSKFKEASSQLSREKALLKSDFIQLKERLHHAAMKLLNTNRKKDALQLMREVEKLAKRRGKLEMAKVRQDLAIVLAENEKYDEAIHLLKSNINLAKRRRDRILLAFSLGNLGEIKRRAGLFEDAQPLLRHAVKICQDLKDKQGEVMWLNNLGLVLADLDRNNEAIKILTLAVIISKKAELYSNAAKVFGSLGNISTKIGRFDEAVDHYNNAIKNANKEEEIDFALSMQFNRAYVYFYDQKIDAAIKDIRAVVQEAFRHLLYTLGTDAAYSGARMTIDSNRPASAGEFTAVNFLGSMMSEAVSVTNFITLMWTSFHKFKDKQYQKFCNALKRQLIHSDKSGIAWKKVETIEKHLHNVDTNMIVKDLKIIKNPSYS